MSQYIEWKKEYELGVEEIDLQHHYFVNLINRISKWLERNSSKEYVLGLVNELDAYAKFHFISEENFMMHEKYPHLSEHKEHHYRLIENLSSKQYKLMSNYSKEEIRGMIKFLQEWFFHHTASEDKQFADFLAKRDIK